MTLASLSVPKCHVVSFHGRSNSVYSIYKTDGNALMRFSEVRDVCVSLYSILTFLPKITSGAMQSFWFLFGNTHSIFEYTIPQNIVLCVCTQQAWVGLYYSNSHYARTSPYILSLLFDLISITTHNCSQSWLMMKELKKTQTDQLTSSLSTDQ